MNAIDKYRALLDEMAHLFHNNTDICPHVCSHCAFTADCQRETEIMAEMENLRKG